MLNTDALSQLRQLKAQIKAAKLEFDGVIAFAASRSATVLLDDGRRFPLAPDDVPKILGDDRVRVELVRNAEDQEIAKLEAVLATPFKRGTGRVVARGNNLFVEPDHPRMNRWLFVPPPQRAGAQDGEWVSFELSRHPQKDGKAGVKITARIGSDSDVAIERRYAQARAGLPGWPEGLEQAALDEARALFEAELGRRENLEALPFVTIDNDSTKDMDDALYAEAVEGGWRLHVAIADPAAVVPAGSALDKLALQRASTGYFPGEEWPMLPYALAHDLCSLLADQPRLALVCSLEVNADGGVTGSQWREAVVRSRARLSYAEVSAHLDGSAPQAALGADLSVLAACALRMADARQASLPKQDDRPDYDLIANAQGKLERIEREPRTEANRVVEACMIAANLDAARFLAERGDGVFNAHLGLRPERHEQARQVLREQAPDLAEADFTSLSGYVELMRALDARSLERPVRAILARLMERARLSATPAPHFGLGAEAYTTATSPIRRYNDFQVHRLIKAALNGSTAPAVDMAVLQEGLDRVRQAVNFCERWLECQYADGLVGQDFDGHIVAINGGGFSVRLADNGLQGFVDLRGFPEKLSFDATWFAHQGASVRFELEQPVRVKVAGVDHKRRSIKLELDPALLPSAAT